ncbi:hypothetical protein DUI87_10191 [Hirundo rustica rustica]|uniref:Uncharacterized protein n=1 Tax=Hirundo rustica rustica TaxID=333673 RepID=A0A3M0KZV2_HIRRU|nr:hypothetical protein DUI87_10191 [Hirundo rustica rustica]
MHGTRKMQQVANRNSEDMYGTLNASSDKCKRRKAPLGEVKYSSDKNSRLYSVISTDCHLDKKYTTIQRKMPGNIIVPQDDDDDDDDDDDYYYYF